MVQSCKHISRHLFNYCTRAELLVLPPDWPLHALGLRGAAAVIALCCRSRPWSPSGGSHCASWSAWRKHDSGRGAPCAVALCAGTGARTTLTE